MKKRETERIMGLYKGQQTEPETPPQDDILAVPLCVDEPCQHCQVDIHNDERLPVPVSSVTVGCQAKPQVQSKHCQTTRSLMTQGTQTVSPNVPKMKDVGQLVRPEYLEPANNGPKTTLNSSPSVENDLYSTPMKDDPKDVDYEPSPSSTSKKDEVTESNDRYQPHQPHQCAKYIVFLANLLQLFKVCVKCSAPTTGVVEYVQGSLVKIRQECQTCTYVRSWFSQPFIGSKPAGNVLISAAILYSGSLPTKILRMFAFMKVAHISISTYMQHQKNYLYPTIAHVWYNFQSGYISKVKATNRPVILGGDGRADTPGHSAKFGSYTMLDLEVL